MKKLARPILWTIFGIYCFILIYILFLSRGAMTHYSYAQYFRQFTNFIPFKTIIEYVERYNNGFRNLSVMNLLGNFFLFTPMGMLLPCVFPKLNSFWKVTLTVLGMVVIVEIAQGLLRVGSIDIDDVLFNVIGAMIGYGIIKIPPVEKMLRKVLDKNAGIE
ncbi:MAG: VanZ family protein [Clostridia bacterium]|nr:VanZ family protein [Clostridia bacterium]